MSWRANDETISVGCMREIHVGVVATMYSGNAGEPTTDRGLQYAFTPLLLWLRDATGRSVTFAFNHSVSFAGRGSRSAR